MRKYYAIEDAWNPGSFYSESYMGFKGPRFMTKYKTYEDAHRVVEDMQTYVIKIVELYEG